MESINRTKAKVELYTNSVVISMVMNVCTLACLACPHWSGGLVCSSVDVVVAASAGDMGAPCQLHTLMAFCTVVIDLFATTNISWKISHVD